MSDEVIKELRTRINELQTENRALKDETIERRGKLSEAKRARVDYEAKIATLTAALDKANGDLTSAAAERDQWKAKADATPGELGLKVKDLEAQIRTRDHRDEWTKQVGDQLADKATVEKVWREIDYTPGEAMPTPEQIKEQAGKARDAAPYLFRASAETAAGAPGGAKVGEKPPLKVAEAPGRGARDSTAGAVRISRSEMSTPGWMTKNKAGAEAFLSGNYTLTDD